MEAILFDWDGTLVDSLGAIYDANATVMAAFGLPFDVGRLSPALRARLARDVPAARRPRRPARGGERALGDGLRRRRRHRPARSPARPTALERLRDAGASLGIVTAGHREVVEPQLERTGLGAPPAGPGLRRRPAGPQAGPGAAAARRSGSPATAIGRRRSVYVGDAPTDMRMARRRRRPRDRDRIGPRRPRRAPRGRGRTRSRRRSPPGSSAHLAAARGRGRRPVERAPRDGMTPSPRADPRRRHGRAGAATSTPPGRAGPTGSTSSSPPTAARGMRPALGRPIDRWVGDGDSIDAGGARAARGRRASGSTARRSTRTRPTRSWPCSPRSSAEPARITILGALGGTRLDHELGNVWLLAHPAPRRPRRPPARRRTPDPPRRAGPDGPRRAGRRPRLAAAVRRRRPAGSRPTGLRYPLRDEPLRIGPSRGLSNVRDDADGAARPLRTGRLLVVETPARLRR